MGLGGDGSDLENMSRSMVNVLLVTIGVEGLNETRGGEPANPPSVMISPRPMMVSVKLIPWFPWEGDSVIHISKNKNGYSLTGLLLFLKVCTRNCAICSNVGLLGVLMRHREYLPIPLLVYPRMRHHCANMFRF